MFFSTKLLENKISFFKIGLRIFIINGFKLIDEIKEKRKKVFLDLKLYDIKSTIQETVAKISEHQIDFLTVNGDPSIVEAAVNGRKNKKKVCRHEENDDEKSRHARGRGKQSSRAAVQQRSSKASNSAEQRSRAAKQECSRAVEQQMSRAAEQRSSRAAKQAGQLSKSAAEQ